MTQRHLQIADIGRRPYLEVLELQRCLRQARLDGTLAEDLLLLVEHEPVYTLGRSTKASSLPMAAPQLRESGADVIDVERGGDVTWHGPGQLVGYPILHLSQHREDLHWYLRTLEAVLIGTLSEVGLVAHTVAGKTGVWVDDRKIASMGIHVRQWVTLHGFAINVDPDLRWFDAIVPCGLHGVTITSVARELGIAGRQHDLVASLRRAAASQMAKAFSLQPAPTDLQQWLTPADFAAKTCDSGAADPPFMHYG